MARTPRKTKRAVKASLTKNFGNMSAAAFDLGYTSRSALYGWLEKYPDLAELVAEQREYITDVAEEHHYKYVIDGNGKHVMFELRTRGKKRGYVERTETTGEDGGAIQQSIDFSALTDDDLRRLEQILSS